MKIALVHDHLLEFGGAERVLVALKKIFPEADVYLSAYNQKVVERWIPDFSTWNVRVSWVSKIPFYHKLYSPLRFLAPFIWESFDFTKYDVVISSSGWFMSKGILTKPPTKHISYIHHPPSYLYYYQTAIEWQKYFIIKLYAHFINHFLRIWDFISSQRPDILVANSQETRRRIQKFYRRDAQVIYPPVDILRNEPSFKPVTDGYYVTVSRLAFKKHIDLLIKAANLYKFPLKIAGSGRDLEALKALAGPTVELLGYVPDEKLSDLFAGAKAFLNASEDEEFGISAVEAMGYGVPVIAYASGGLKETVEDGKNGFLFEELTERSLHEALQKFEKSDISAMKKHSRLDAKKYSAEVFAQEILNLMKQT
ncbi:glycosyltransferase [Candidatus Woesebacteria bacterium]|nr:glycosyltransferase [Candidatus Woesebacteria bacterium]